MRRGLGPSLREGAVRNVPRHEPYEGDYWDKAVTFWDNLGFRDYELNQEEFQEGFQLFADFLRDVDMGFTPEQSIHFWDFLNYFGMEIEDFDFDEFREWYDAV
jgi:hypothetical protein